MSTSVVPYQEPMYTKPKKIRPVIDNKNENPPPLDYSFYKLSDLADISEEEPRVLSPRKETAEKATEKLEREKSTGRCLRLNNNDLQDIKLLPEVVSNLFENPSLLGWLDLSFNALKTIDPVLAEFENLQILYLHGNVIEEVNEVEKLCHLKRLWKLTLHGNPLDTVKGYRFQVLAYLPWLLNLDFSCVTKGDRVTAQTLSRFTGVAQKKKKKKSDSED